MMSLPFNITESSLMREKELMREIHITDAYVLELDADEMSNIGIDPDIIEEVLKRRHKGKSSVPLEGKCGEEKKTSSDHETSKDSVLFTSAEEREALLQDAANALSVEQMRELGLDDHLIKEALERKKSFKDSEAAKDQAEINVAAQSAEAQSAEGQSREGHPRAEQSKADQPRKEQAEEGQQPDKSQPREEQPKEGQPRPDESGDDSHIFHEPEQKRYVETEMVLFTISIACPRALTPFMKKSTITLDLGNGVTAKQSLSLDHPGSNAAPLTFAFMNFRPDTISELLNGKMTSPPQAGAKSP